MEMLLNSSENDKLFAKLVPVSKKDAYTNQSRLSHLFLTMEWQEASAGVFNRKVLSISLTDNDDPFFLYNLQLSEEDFQVLKANQDLLINFSSFPQHIIDYIEKCFIEENSPQPKFLLVFTINEKLANVAAPSQLDIVETNQFKNLIHLSLKFIAATESAVKQYLASCFRRLKEERKQLQNNLTYMEEDLKDKLAARESALNDKIQELEKVRKDSHDKLTRKNLDHQKELQEERNKLISKYDDEINRRENDYQIKKSTFEKQIQQLQNSVDVKDRLNKELQDRNYKYESTIQELKSKIISLEEEKRHLEENLQSFKYECDRLQSEVHKKQLHMRNQDEIISDLQQELKSKEQYIVKLMAQNESEIKLRKSVESELEKANFHYNMSEVTRKKLENDNEELNQVIIRLQQESKVLNEQAKTLAKHEKALLANKEEIARLKISLKDKISDLKRAADTISTLQEKCNDKEKEIKEKEMVTKWMHKEMTDHLVIPKYVPPPHLTSPTTVAQKQLAKINSQSPENSRPVLGKNATTKSVRIDALSPVCKHSKSTPHKMTGTDSAYYTHSSLSNQASPEILAGNYNVNFDPSNFEIDQEAVSNAFGDGCHIIKHSTAKKPTKPVKSTTPKTSKKR